ncbi:MAG: HAD family hydrolase [Gaiellaceae bacterium]
MPLKALLFDFDGLIIDTETAARSGWQWAYRQHGFELPEDKWALMVGTVRGWDPAGHLEELVGEAFDDAGLHERRIENERALIEAEQLRPGIRAYLDAAERRGLKRAIVSSATREWIDPHLARLECAVGWDAIVTAELDPERAKPRPVMYLEALETLDVAASEAVAFEDSPNGAAAAKAAGIYVVGVPNAVTRTLGLEQQADVVVESLADLPPDELFARFG